ncbi:MAG: trypsin-like peptidase domain-containing protein [Pseudomonadota bacterium]
MRTRWIRRALGLAAGLGVAALAQATSAETGLKRLTLRQDLLGFEAVGRLDFDGGFCSASLIAPDLVLTAAHCLIHPKTGARLDPTKALFRSGIRDGEAVAESRGARAIVHPDYDPFDENGARKVASDLGILQLADPIPAGVASPFAVAESPGTGAEVSVVSYARGRDAAPSWQRRCSISAQLIGVVEMTCESESGASGSPVFDLSSGRPRIVSVISGRVFREGHVSVWGMQAAEALPRLKADFRADRGVWPARAAVAPRRLTVGVGATRPREGGARFVRP